MPETRQPSHRMRRAGSSTEGTASVTSASSRRRKWTLSRISTSAWWRSTQRRTPGKVVVQTLPEQFEKALAHLLAARAAADVAPQDLTRVTVYATHIADQRPTRSN